MHTVLPLTNFVELAQFFTTSDFKSVNFYFSAQQQLVVTKNTEKLLLVVNLGLQYLPDFQQSMFNNPQNHTTIQNHLQSDVATDNLFLSFKKTPIATTSTLVPTDFLSQFLNYLTTDALFHLQIAKQKYGKNKSKSEYYHLKSHTLFVSEINYELTLRLRKTIYETKSTTTEPILNATTDLHSTNLNTTNPNYLGSEPIFQHHFQTENKNYIKTVLAPIAKLKLSTLKLIPFKTDHKLDQFSQKLKTNYVAKYNQILYLQSDLPALKFFLKLGKNGYEVKKKSGILNRPTFYWRQKRYCFNVTTQTYRTPYFEYLVDLNGINRYNLGIISRDNTQKPQYLTINFKTQLTQHQTKQIQQWNQKLITKFDVKIFQQIWELIQSKTIK